LTTPAARDLDKPIMGGGPDLHQCDDVMKPIAAGRSLLQLAP
jgi:hypothetical protein